MLAIIVFIYVTENHIIVQNEINTACESYCNQIYSQEINYTLKSIPLNSNVTK